MLIEPFCFQNLTLQGFLRVFENLASKWPVSTLLTIFSVSGRFSNLSLPGFISNNRPIANAAFIPRPKIYESRPIYLYIVRYKPQGRLAFDFWMGQIKDYKN